MLRKMTVGGTEYELSVVHGEEPGEYVAFWTQGGERRWTQACASVPGAVDEAKRMARKLEATPPCP